ncbi:MAG: signal peptidase I [Opitutales bacterium]
MLFRNRSEEALAREQADNLLRMAAKVDSYRRDVLPPAQLAALQLAVERLEELRGNPQAGAKALDQACEALHSAMERCGGDIYPVTFWGENIEMLLVAAILAIGIRTFFLQPFKIPTNSMYPTYHGMTPYVYRPDSPEPNALEQAKNFLVSGATHYNVVAPAEGEVRIPVRMTGNPDIVAAECTPVTGRKWFGLLPDEENEYTLFVGDQPVTVRVPKDFTLDQVLLETFFPDLPPGSRVEQGLPARYLAEHGYLKEEPDPRNPKATLNYIATQRQVHEGDRVLNFDRQTGDMLFVDRFTYNFFPPKVGAPFVFSTSGIPGLENMDPPQGGQYFIKRLVGRPGDTLEVRPPVLYSNGAPIQGAASFAKEAARSDGYPGYVNVGSLGPGETITVAPGTFFAMGDNSPLSLDSRFWGGVPQQNVVGRAVFIVYPFSSRWGWAR